MSLFSEQPPVPLADNAGMGDPIDTFTIFVTPPGKGTGQSFEARLGDESLDPQTLEGVPKALSLRNKVVDKLTGAVEVAQNKVAENFGRFIGGVVKVVAASSQQMPDGYYIDAYEFTAHIGAEGNFGFGGTGVGMNASNAITVTVKRNEKPES
ncbi:hypothetical protein ACFL6C_13515 [Myxococcota bacterium]